jgi:predicted amidohydrolase YtcJ
VEQAVHGYTIGAAYAAGREAELGSIAPGKLADLTVLDRDIFTIAAQEIRETQVAATIVEGKFAHRTF